MALLQPIGILISNKVCVWMTLFLSAYFVYYIKVQLYLIKCNCISKNYFYYYLWVSLHFLILFMGPIILFQLIFTFIYNIFRKKFSILIK